MNPKPLEPEKPARDGEPVRGDAPLGPDSASAHGAHSADDAPLADHTPLGDDLATTAGDATASRDVADEAATSAELATSAEQTASAEPTKPVSPLFAVLNRIRHWVTIVLAGICLVLFVFLVIVVTWQVFTRQVLNNAAPWTTEASTYTFVVLSLFAAAYVFGERGHIAVEMLVEKFAPVAQKGIVILVELAVIFFVIAAYIVGGLAVAQGSANQNISSLPLTVGQIYSVMPVAGGIIIFFSLVHIIGILTGDDTALTISDEIEEAV